MALPAVLPPVICLISVARAFADGSNNNRSEPPRQTVMFFAPASAFRVDMKDFVSASQSTRLGARKLYHLAPFLSFISHELSEIGSGAAKHCAAKVGKPRLYLGVGEARVDLVIEPVDDLAGCVPGCADAEPTARLVTRQELAHARDVRQHVRARRAGHCQCAQFAGPDVLNRRSRGGGHDLHLSAEQGCECRGHPTIGDVNHVDAGHHH